MIDITQLSFKKLYQLILPSPWICPFSYNHFSLGHQNHAWRLLHAHGSALTMKWADLDSQKRAKSSSLESRSFPIKLVSLTRLFQAQLEIVYVHWAWKLYEQAAGGSVRNLKLTINNILINKLVCKWAKEWKTIEKLRNRKMIPTGPMS